MLNWINKKMKKRKGFTLVELVVVIAILGILAGIAVPKLTGSRTNAAISAHNANFRTLESAATLAVSEGSGAVTWTGAATPVLADGKLPTNAWENYLQTWPAFPKGLAGKELNMEVSPATNPPTYTKTAITGNEVYKVVIDANGGITVTPGKAE